MNKKGFLLKAFIIVLVLVGIYLWVNFLVGSSQDDDNDDNNNDTNNNTGIICVPATCCHPTGCVPKGQEQDCAAVSCTSECAPGTLDCNQARCEPINRQCEVVFNLNNG